MLSYGSTWHAAMSGRRHAQVKAYDTLRRICFKAWQHQGRAARSTEMRADQFRSTRLVTQVYLSCRDHSVLRHQPSSWPSADPMRSREHLEAPGGAFEITSVVGRFRATDTSISLPPGPQLLKFFSLSLCTQRKANLHTADYHLLLTNIIS